jgi:hypothetical protein
MSANAVGSIVGSTLAVGSTDGLGAVDGGVG